MLFRSIRASLGRYLAILSIVALGVGFYAGLDSSEPAMRSTAATYMDETGMYDFRLLSTLGFSAEDVENLRNSKEVSAAEGAFFAETLTEIDGEEEPLLFMSLTREVSVPVLFAGRMPDNPGECLGDKAYFSQDDIGKTIRISSCSGSDVSDRFKVGEFIITGLAGSPRFISSDRGSTSLGGGKIVGFVIVLPEAFDGEIYHELLVDCGLSASFTDEYMDAADKLEPRIEALLNTVAADRYRKLRNEADEELADARSKLDDGWKEYGDGKAEAEQKLADGRKEIDDARRELQRGETHLNISKREADEGLAKLNEAEETLKNNQKLLDEKAAELEAGEAELEKNEQIVAAARSAFDATKSATLSGLEKQKEELISQLSKLGETIRQLEGQDTEEARAELQGLYSQQEQLNAALGKVVDGISEAESTFNTEEQSLVASEQQLAAERAKLEAGKSDLAKARAELDYGKKQLEENRKKLEDGLKQISYGYSKIRTGYAELEDAEEELKQAEEDAEAELKDALAELKDGENEYSDAVAEVDDKLKLEVHCLGRDSNYGCATFKNDITIVSAVAKAFPAFFALIAALVCVTTMTRMVNEERTQIGTLKALGFSGWKTASKYILYAGSAAFLGCIFGLITGVTVIPYVVWYAYTILYNYAPLRLYFNVYTAVIPLMVAVPGIMAVSAFACRKELKEKPAGLIRPKAPASGKRILLERIRPVWKRFGFLTKVMLRNAFRRPARVLMMVVGIGGCTALMIAGFGAEDSLAHVMDYQYGEIFQYDITAFYDSDVYPTSSEVSKVWSDYVDSSALIWQGDADMTAPDGKSRSVRLRAADEDVFQGVVSFSSEGLPAAYPKQGEVMITTGIADILKLSVGDIVVVSGADIPPSELKVCSIADNYVEKYVYVNPESIGSPVTNTALLTGGDNAAYAAAAIRAAEGIDYVTCASDERASMEKSMSSMGLIIIMVVVCSAALAFITVFNLTNINIMERIREIATVKVLGFRKKETAAYVLKENLLLSILGALAGLPLGKLLHRFIMELIKVEYLTYDIRILPKSYAVSFAAAVIFVLIINRLMNRRLEGVNMAESLKSVE